MILKSPVFWGVLAVKIVFAYTFASDFLVKLFARFINYFVASGFQNPYDFFYSLGELNIFPYPRVMLWILSIPRVVLATFLGSDFNLISNSDIFIYRLPILAADIIIFIILARWLKNKQNKVLVYYWCSPILFYINYVHGQLDAIPMMFLFAALYLLFKEMYVQSFLLLSFAVAAKTGMILVIPFAFVYLLLKKVDWVRAVVLALMPIVLFALINLDYLYSPAFREIVLNNKEQIKIFDFNYKFSDSLVLYFVPLAYLALLIKSLTYKSFNRDIFLMFLGFSFGILTLFIPPMPGWYYWIIPFFIYFYIKEGNAPKFTFLLLNAFYFIYFLITKSSDFPQVFQLVAPNFANGPNLYEYLVGIGVDAEKLVNIAFTLLQGTLLVNILWIYKRGIESNVQYKIKYQSYLIGIAGDSGAGKNTFATLLSAAFGRKNTLIIEGDDMHKWERGDANWSKYTHLDPRANSLHAELANASSLKGGVSIQRSFYDHQSGKFTIPKRLSARRVIIFQGLHSFYLDRMRTLFDLKIFLKPSEELRAHWKVSRDTKERGYDKAKVLNQIKSREGDSLKYIQSQEKHADIVVSVLSKNDIDNLGDEINLDLILKLKFENNVNVDPFLTELARCEGLFTNRYYEDDHQYLELCGVISKQEVGDIAMSLIPELNDIIECEPSWEDDYNGLLQLFTCYFIFSKMKLDGQVF